MKLQKLRLAGFKSFVDPTEFLIEPGLTGVVGPNGCGKSNLLESLRWVMGAASAKALRAGGMDDVIFAGGGGRAPRSHAEVTLTLDNADRRAPAAFNDDPVLQVNRRIDRGEGSTYRINGREVRARDVQLLFADASTGANSPALVRQGQISELIAAKPENRRRILEEAGGVGGLHARRHEAELRLRAAEANLERLDDVLGELDSALNRLKREARQAERYKRLSAEIRALQSALLHARWTETAEAVRQAQAEVSAAGAQVEETIRAAALAAAEAAEAEASLPALRDDEMVAAAVLQRLTFERDRLKAEEDRARADAERLKAELVRLAADREREAAVAADAAGQLERLDRLLASAEAELAAAPERLPALNAAAEQAETARAAAEAEVERLAAELSAADARRRADAARRADLQAVADRACRALDGARADRAAVPEDRSDAAAQADAELAAAEAALAAARAALETAETARADAGEAEAAARRRTRELEDRLGRLKSEARGLAELLAPARKAGFPPALDAISVEPGFEAALAAALGDDLEAALDPAAPSRWAGAEVRPFALPEGVEPLAAHVTAPEPLAARLAAVGVCARHEGQRLAAALPVGARLVTREGDLWRWDGFTARADAPRPAAVRLAQRGRLAALEAELETLSPEAAHAAAAQKAALAAVQEAGEAVAAARRDTPAAERRLQQARDAVARHAAETARRLARIQALDETLARFEAAAEEAQAAIAALGPAPADDRPDPAAVQALADARAASAGAREAAAQARAAREAEAREAHGRARRVEALRRDHADWTRRRASAAARVQALEADNDRALAAAETARHAPAEAAERRERLADEAALAEARRRAAAETLAAADARRTAADRAARTADRAAADAREARAAADARLEAAAEREAEAADRLRELSGLEPEELGRRLAESATALPREPEGMEAHLRALEAERERLGGVNLLAEEEASAQGARLNELQAERADLHGAIAKLRQGVAALNEEGRERLLAAFSVIDGHFRDLFQTLFGGGQAELRLVESDDPLEAGLEIYACPPGKRLASMSLMSGGEQALTACALIFAVFLANPAPICVLDEVDAPLDDANVDRFCRLLEEMARRTDTPFLVITHNGVTMSRMDRLYGVTMPERGVSQLVGVDLRGAERMAAE